MPSDVKVTERDRCIASDAENDVRGVSGFDDVQSILGPYIATARAEGHAAGLEEAAKACELWATARGAVCADGIRALGVKDDDQPQGEK